MKRETFDKLCCALRGYAEKKGADRSLWYGGRVVPELDLLQYLLDIAAHEGADPRTGNIAGALDMWLAEELRLAGLDERGVWPRNQPPQVLDPSIADLTSRLPESLARALQREMGNVGGTEARVRGAAYAKQVDVGMATWPSGPDLLISTKTMSGSFGKNWANRFEEAYGDIKNLKGRHPARGELMPIAQSERILYRHRRDD